MPKIMLDLETVDNSPTSAVLSIGAVCDVDPSNTFHRHLLLEPQLQKGCTISTDTLVWWFKQGDEARMDQVAAERTDPHTALSLFATWASQFGDDVEIWGNGASFDEPIVRNLLTKFGVSIPWKFWNVKCYRTLKAMYPKTKLNKANQHTALGDALNQLEHLERLLARHAAGMRLAETAGL